ncbi:MAG: metallophosphoesterase family protein [Candidatus Omnitrophota bacterium]
MTHVTHDPTSLTFLHTADWHIGHSFFHLERDMRKKLRQAIFRTIEMIFLYARQSGIPLILCAGDTLDNGQWGSKDDVHALFHIIRKYPAIRVVTIAGNHDALLNRNIYSQIEKAHFPPNLVLIEGNDVLDYPEWNLTIFAESVREKNTTSNPLNWINEKAIDPKKINIGLGHGRIDPGFAFEHGLDYLALGGNHSYQTINDRTFYPGVPEPLTFDDNGAVLQVTVTAPEKKLTVERAPIESQYRWKRMHEQVNEDTFPDFKSTLEKRDEKEIRELTVSGCLPLETYTAYRELLGKNRTHGMDIRDHVVMKPDEHAFPHSVDGCMNGVIRRLLELKQSNEPLPEGIVNPYVSIERTEVHRRVNELKGDRDAMIDSALMQVYHYLKEKGK